MTGKHQMDPQIEQLLAARREGRYADSLVMLQQALAEAGNGENARVREFATRFEWKMLAEEYPPARAALVAERDAQVARLLAGELGFSTSGSEWERSRFAVIHGMNLDLGEAAADYPVFVQLHQHAPEYARSNAFLAMPAVVAAGDFALAEQYLEDPLPRLAAVNELARTFVLFPSGREAPRLAADLGNFVKDVRLLAEVFEGTGREGQASSLRTAALTGLETQELRDWAERELAEPGALRREAVARRMDEEEPPAAPL